MPERDSAMRKRMRAAIARKRPACHICGDPINYALPHTDAMSFVVDHVIPLAKGGRDDMTNAAAAHRECNSKKRARLYAPIVRRSRSLE